MSTGTTATTTYTKILDQGSARLDRLFYVIAACTMLFLTFVGFEPFYLHGKGFGGAQMTTQIVPLIVTHGLAMSSWVVLFLVQSLLIVSGNRRVHMTVGVVGATLAAVIVILGMTVATLSVHFNAQPYKLFGRKIFLGNNAHRHGLIWSTCRSWDHESPPPRNPPPNDALGYSGLDDRFA